MTTEQISIQLSNISDAVQLLARSNVTIEHHSHLLDGMVEKNKDYDQRIRDIESLIHQACDLKSKEINESSKRVHERMDSISKESKQTSLLYSAVVASIGLVLFGLVWKTDGDQDIKNDKVYTEIFTVLREVKANISEVKANLAVITTNQTHYQKELHDHMEHEEAH